MTGGLLFAEVFEEAGFPEGMVNVATCTCEAIEAFTETRWITSANGHPPYPI